MFEDLIPAGPDRGASPGRQTDPGDSGRAPLRITIGKGSQQSDAVDGQPGQAPQLSERDRKLLIRTVLGEAAGEDDTGQQAVASVILNRLRAGKFGNSVPSIIAAKNQFEPWMTPQGRQKMLSYAEDGPDYGRASANLEAILGGKVEDPTNGATHFYSPKAQAALGRQPPKWAQGDPVVVGNHHFFAPGETGAVKVASNDKTFTPGAKSAPAPDAPAENMFSDLVPKADPASNFKERFSGEGMGVPTAKAPELAQSLREKADNDLIGESTPGQQLDTANAEMLNTLLLNAPRNLKAAVWSHIKGQPFEQTYEELKAREEAGARQNPVSAGVGIGAGVGVGMATMPAIKGGVTIASRAVRAGATGAGYGVAAELLDSKDPIRASVAGALGAALGGVASPIAEKIVGLVSKLVASGKQSATFLKPDGTLSDDALAAAKEAGIDPDVLAKVMHAKYAETFSKKGASPATAREAAADEFGVKLTPGEANADYGAIAREQAMARDAHGPLAGNKAREFYDAREGQVTRAKTGIQERVAEQQPLVDSVNDAANMVGQGVRGKATAAKTEYKGAYDDALGREGEFSDIAFIDIGQRIRKDALKGDSPVVINDRTTPVAASAIQHLDENIGKLRIQDRAQPRAEVPSKDIIGADGKLVKAVEDRASPVFNPADPWQIAGVNLKGVEQARKELVSFYKSAKASGNAEDIRAMRRLIAGFDDELETAMATGLFKGDDQALSALKNARKLFANYQKTFRSQGPGDTVGKAMEKIVERDATGGEIANYLYGKAAIGEKGDAVRLAAKLKSMFGANSEEWSAVRQGLWLRLTSQPEGVKDFGPQHLSTRISKFLSGDGADMAKVMFSPKELGEMRRFATIMNSITPPVGAVNHSNTYYALAREGLIGAGIGGSAFWLTNDPVTSAALAGLKVGGKLSRELFRGGAAKRYFNSGAPRVPGEMAIKASRGSGVAAGELAGQAQ